MPIERLYARQQLPVVPERDEDLRVVAHALLQHGQRSLGRLVLLQLANLSLVELRLGRVDVLTVEREDMSAYECRYGKQGRLTSCWADGTGRDEVVEGGKVEMLRAAAARKLETESHT